MNRAMKLNVKSASVVLVFVLAVGLAFYGGRAYQNNIDQPLFGILAARDDELRDNTPMLRALRRSRSRPPAPCKTSRPV